VDSFGKIPGSAVAAREGYAVDRSVAYPQAQARRRIGRSGQARQAQCRQGSEILLGPPFIDTEENIDKFDSPKL
jgi:hypothetical protein